MNNLEETDRKDPIMKRKGEARYLRGHKKDVIRNLFEWQKSKAFPKEV